MRSDKDDTEVVNGLSSVHLADWPVYRNNIIDFLEHSRRLHHISATWEIDVTAVLQAISEIQRQTRMAISFNAYMIYVFARAVSKHPETQAVKVPFRRKIAHFDGVDVGTAIEQRTAPGTSIALPYTIRNAHTKSLLTICLEMRKVRKTNLLLTHPEIVWRGKLAHYPKWVRKLVWRWVDLSPERRRRIRGTVGVTNISFLSDGKRPGYGYPMSLLSTGLCVGAIYERMEPCSENPRGFEMRKKLCVTMQSNHDLVDGAPMTRVARSLTASLERSEGLDASFVAEVTEHMKSGGDE